MTNQYFDTIPIEKTRNAKAELQKAAAGLDPNIIKRVLSSGKLSDSDQEAILKVAKKTIVTFDDPGDEKKEAKPEEKVVSNPEKSEIHGT